MGEMQGPLLSPAASKIVRACFLAGYILAVKLLTGRKAGPVLPRRRKSRLLEDKKPEEKKPEERERRPMDARTSSTYRGELESVASRHLVNDPENTGNVWLRVDQLGRTVKCLTEDNAKLLDEKNILIKDKRSLEAVVLELQRANEQHANPTQATPLADVRRTSSYGTKPVLKAGSGPLVMAVANALNVQAALEGSNGSLSKRNSFELDHQPSWRKSDVKSSIVEHDLRQTVKELQEEVGAAQREKREAVAEVIKLREDNQRLAEGAAVSDSQIQELKSSKGSLLEESKQLKVKLEGLMKTERGISPSPATIYATDPAPLTPDQPRELDQATKALRGAAAPNLATPDDAEALREALAALAEAKEAREVAEGQLAAANERIKGLELQNRDLAQEVAKLRVVSQAPTGSAGKAARVAELEQSNGELTSQLAEAKRKNTKLLAKLRKAEADAAAATPNMEAIAKEELQERLNQLELEKNRLTQENTVLQRKVMEFSNATAATNSGVEVLVRQLQEQKSMLQDDNARLQSKIVRLNKAAPAVQAAQDMLEQLRKENELLHDDNNKLVAYIESLPPSLQTAGPRSPTQVPPGTDTKSAVDSYVDLRSENQRLVAETRRLMDELQTLRSLKPHINEVPVLADTGETVDQDMWALLEDLRVQNRLLMEENSALRTAPPLPPKGEEDNLAYEVERLKRQLATVMESKAKEINEDNLRLLNTLTEENRALEEQVHKLLDRMVARGSKGVRSGGRTGAVLQEVVLANERIAQEKHKVHVEVTKLAEKNAVLLEENEKLVRQVAGLPPVPAPATAAAVAAALPLPRKQNGVMSKLSSAFRRNKASKPDPLPLVNGVGTGAGAGDGMRVMNAPTVIAAGARARASSDGGSERDSGLYGNLLPDLIEENVRLAHENQDLASRAQAVKHLEEENAKLMQENHRLGSSVADLVKELSDENEHLDAENRQLASSMEMLLRDNQDLANRLVDVALSGSAFGDSAFTDSGGAFDFDKDATRRRNAKLAQELEQVHEEQVSQAQRRADLAMRAGEQLQELHRMQGLATSSSGASPTPAGADAALASTAESVPGKAAGGAAAVRDVPPLALGGFQTPPERKPHANGFPPESPSDEARRKRIDAELQQEAAERRAHANSLPPTPQALRNMLRGEAQAQVSAAYMAYAHDDDVNGFMASLGYEGSSLGSHALGEPAQLQAAFQRALRRTDPEAYSGKSDSDKALAAATHSRLLEWMQEYDYLPPIVKGHPVR